MYFSLLNKILNALLNKILFSLLNMILNENAVFFLNKILFLQKHQRMYSYPKVSVLDNHTGTDRKKNSQIITFRNVLHTYKFVTR